MISVNTSSTSVIHQSNKIVLSSPNQVTIAQQSNTIILSASPTLTISNAGIQGPQGEAGPQGANAADIISYTYFGGL